MDREQAIDEAYAQYDSDPRVHGIDDMDAFRDAVRPLVKECEQKLQLERERREEVEALWKNVNG